ncbi:MAG: helix-turn-helix domain-containing protein [Salinibacter sp.]
METTTAGRRGRPPRPRCRPSWKHKDWLTLEEAARYADITTATLRGWRENGLPEAEVKGRIYIEREELDSFIASHVEE